jgi:hypothetical protein
VETRAVKAQPSPATPKKKKRPRPKKHAAVFLLMALLGTNLEVLTRVGTLVGHEPLNLKPLSLAGWTSLWMLPVYGTAGLALGQLNEIKEVRRWPMLCQCLLGLGVAWVIELAAGYVLNIQLGLAVWDYSRQMLNFKGQISLISGLQFFVVTPMVFWADDLVRYLAYRERGMPDSLASYYRALFSFKIREDEASEQSPSRAAGASN